MLRKLACALVALVALAVPARAADPIKIGFSMALTGGGRAERQADPGGARDLARRRQRQGRAARAAGRARLLRRPEQSGERAGTLHQTAQRRQGRSADRALRDQHGGAGDAGDHAAQQDDDQHSRPRREPAVQVRRYFSTVPTGDEGPPAFSKGFFELAKAQNPEPKTVAIVAADAEFGQIAATARASTPRRPASTSSTTKISAQHHRFPRR